MKVFLKRETTSGNVIFTVKDCMGDDKYTVTAKEGTPMSKAYIKDNSGIKRLVIRRINLPMYSLYSISAGGERISLVTSHGTVPECIFYGISWHIRGDVRKKSYDIVDADNSVVAAVSKAGVGKCDALALNIFCEQRELFSIGVAVCLSMEKAVDCEVFQTI